MFIKSLGYEYLIWIFIIMLSTFFFDYLIKKKSNPNIFDFFFNVFLPVWVIISTLDCIVTLIIVEDFNFSFNSIELIFTFRTLTSFIFSTITSIYLYIKFRRNKKNK